MSRYGGNAMATIGWYPDPYGTSELRYWDGTTWTEYVSPVATPPPFYDPFVTPALVALPWYKRKVTIAVSSVIALLVLFVIIGVVAGKPKTKNASTTITTSPS